MHFIHHPNTIFHTSKPQLLDLKQTHRWKLLKLCRDPSSLQSWRGFKPNQELSSSLPSLLDHSSSLEDSKRPRTLNLLTLFIRPRMHAYKLTPCYCIVSFLRIVYNYISLVTWHATSMEGLGVTYASFTYLFYNSCVTWLEPNHF